MAPQIRNISEQGGSRSRVNIVMSACSEAKSVGLALQLGYFLVGNRICYGDSAIIGTIKNYVNLDVDTVWLTRNDRLSLLPDDIQWICGKCKVEERWAIDPCCASCISGQGGLGPKPIRHVAVNFMNWLNPDDEGSEMGTWETCERHDTKELLLIVGNVKVVEWETDISFVAPAQPPCETYIYMSKDLKVPDNPGLEILNQFRSKTWQELEEVMVRKAEEFKLQRAKERQEAFTCTCVHYLET